MTKSHVEQAIIHAARAGKLRAYVRHHGLAGSRSLPALAEKESAEAQAALILMVLEQRA